MRDCSLFATASGCIDCTLGTSCRNFYDPDQCFPVNSGTRYPRGITVSRRLPVAVAPLLWSPLTSADDVSFSRDIRPILAANCLGCHGTDEGHREGEPRLDTFSGAKAQHQGRAAIVPGKPDASELLTRVKSHDADSVMPPRETCKALAAQQVDMLERWIQSWAEYQQHWAFMTPVSPPVPEFADEQCRQWIKNPIHVLFCSDFKKKACIQHRSRNPGHCCGERPSI